MVCSSRASIIRLAVATYFLGTISATAMAVTMVAMRATKNALRRAPRARMYCFRSICRISLEQCFSDENDVVRLDGVAQAGVGLDQLAVRAGPAQLHPAVAAARRNAAAGGDRLHHRHVGLDAVGAGARHLAVDVEHRGTLDVDGLAALQRVRLAEHRHALLLAVADHEHGVV